MVGFLWKRSLDQYITILDDCYDWLCGSGNKEYYLLNVYLPYESEENRDRFNVDMAKIAIYVDTINSTCVTIIGDFNSDISKKSMFGNIFLNFCNKYSMIRHIHICQLCLGNNLMARSCYIHL